MLLLGLAAAVMCACTSATNLDTQHLPPGQGVVLGRIRAFYDTTEVTGDCYVMFTDERNEPRAELVLDREGWVISTLPRGRMFLSAVWCSGYGGLTYHSRDLDFDVAGNGRITYFGHLRFNLHPSPQPTNLAWLNTGPSAFQSTTGLFLEALVKTVIGATALMVSQSAGEDEPPRQGVEVSDRSYEAVREYQARYNAARELDLAFALAGPRAAVDPRLRPEIIRSEELVYSEIPLNGLKLVWLGRVRETQHKLALRLRRQAQRPAFQECRELGVVMDARRVRLRGAVYRQEPVPEGFEETLQVETDTDTLSAIGAAEVVELHACGLSRKLPAHAIHAATDLVHAYRALEAEVAGATDAVAP